MVIIKEVVGDTPPIKSWWAAVMKTPLFNKIMVLSNGTPKGFIKIIVEYVPSQREITVEEWK